MYLMSLYEMLERKMIGLRELMRNLRLGIAFGMFLAHSIVCHF